MTGAVLAAAGSLALSAVDVNFGGTFVLHGIDLAVGRGEAVAVIGPSGAGKTTLLRLLSGAVVPAAGRVTLEGRDLQGLSGRELRRQRARLGFVHQDLRLVPNLRVVQNVLSGRLGSLGVAGTLRLMFRPAAADLEEVHRLLERVGLADRMYERVDRLSGGQAQRVAVARAFLRDTPLVLLDEPTAHLDPGTEAVVLDAVRRLCIGRTAIVATHARAARNAFGQVLELQSGRAAGTRMAGE